MRSLVAKGPDPSDALAGETRPSVEGFVVLGLLGTGGYSRVYRAQQTGFDRGVALKVLNVGIATDDQQRTFERECRAMGVLSQHPNIVTVFSAAMTTTRQPCIAMELYSGGTVGDRVRTTGPLEVSEVLDIGIRIAGALQAAHDRGVVHRDIKPQNIFLSEYGQPALGDFGISSFDDDRTITGGGGLTVHYAPPELIGGEPAGATSDVYSLAASLFTLATGQRPFPRHEGQTLGELARQILVQPAPRLEGPPELADLLEQSMAKSAAARPASAAEFGTRLQTIQRQLSLAETEMVMASSASSQAEESKAADPDDSETIVSVAVDAGPRVAGTSLSRPSVVDVGLWTRRGLVAAGVMASGIAVAIGLLARLPDSAVVPDVETASTLDEFFSVPVAPGGLVIERAPGSTSASVRWNRSSEADRYQIERLDTGSVVEVDETEAVLELESAVPLCVTVTAVGAGGKLSPPSNVACSD